MNNDTKANIKQINDPILRILITILITGISTLYFIQISRYSDEMKSIKEERQEFQMERLANSKEKDSLHRVIEALSRNNSILDASIQILTAGVHSLKSENKEYLKKSVHDLIKIKKQLKNIIKE